MHERGPATRLVRMAAELASGAGADRVVEVAHVRVGALSGISPQHLRDYFAQASRGTVVAGAALDIDVVDDPADPDTVGLRLVAVDVAGV